MKHKMYNKLLAFCISLPLAFSLFFFGYLPMRFDAIIYTDNIVGEGTCSSYLSGAHDSFAYLYQADAYFGSELKTLKLVDLAYNVDTVELFAYDVEEADIISFDICIFGRTVSHLNKDGLSHPMTAAVHSATTTGEAPLVHLTKDKDTGIISMAFPGASIIPAWVWIAYFSVIFLSTIVFAAFLYFVFTRVPWTRPHVMNVSSIVLTMIVGCFICGSLPYVDYTYFLLNGLVLFAAALFINSLTLPWLGTVLVSMFTLFWYTANHYVILFRSKPIMPADLKAFGTAREVAGGYDLTPNWQIVVGSLVVLAYLAMLIVEWRRSARVERVPLKKRMILRGTGVAVAVALMLLGVNNPAFAQLNTFQWDAKVLEGFHREGIVLTFVKSAISAHVERPEGYSREKVDAFLKDYPTQVKTDAIHPTRIIMVMNEAFADLRTVGLDKGIDVMPFIDSLDENTIEGSLYVSVFGGGTCNTEFEALTGNTLAFLSTGAYPYTENVTEPLFSLASYFRENGYDTEAFHASTATSWNRNVVYPNLGFDVFHAIDDYPNITKESYLHNNYVTDATDYAYIEQRDMEVGGKPRFLFNVTIQNHADYDHFDKVEEAGTLKPFEDKLHQNARVYLSLIKVSDDAIQALLEQYRATNEPTMIVFFGDHQPMLPSAAQEDVYTQMNYYLDNFKSKFFIWTNYETETEYNTAISANFLPWLILERGNFPMPPYLQMLKEVYEKYPVISSQGVMDADGNVYENVAVLLDDPLIQRYQYIQYANLFDEIDPAWFEVK